VLWSRLLSAPVRSTAVVAGCRRARPGSRWQHWPAGRVGGAIVVYRRAAQAMAESLYAHHAISIDAEYDAGDSQLEGDSDDEDSDDLGTPAALSK
jgi:hypothetical protein